VQSNRVPFKFQFLAHDTGLDTLCCKFVVSKC